MLAAPNGDLLTLICSDVKLLPPAQVSVGVVPATTVPAAGEDGVGAVGLTTAACVEKVELLLVTQVPLRFAPEQAVTSQR